MFCSPEALQRSLIAVLSFGLLCRCAAAQPAFDVASVKLTPPAGLNHLKFERCINGGRFVTAGTPLAWVIDFAWHVQQDHLLGAPAWTLSFSDAYDIEGKGEGSVSQENCRLMVRALLADRFKLAVHQEAREVAAFALVTGKKTAKLRTVDKAADPGGVGGVRINGGIQQSLSEPEAPAGWSMATLANYLANFAGRPVVDETGLPGTYAFSLEFARSPQEEETRPSVFTAVEQLGLRLRPTRASIDVLVIDHIERPDVN